MIFILSEQIKTESSVPQGSICRPRHLEKGTLARNELIMYLNGNYLPNCTNYKFYAHGTIAAKVLEHLGVNFKK